MPSYDASSAQSRDQRQERAKELDPVYSDVELRAKDSSRTTGVQVTLFQNARFEEECVPKYAWQRLEREYEPQIPSHAV